MGLFESVPNFSEGRRPDVVAAIAAGARAAHLLDMDADPDHNRAVLSVAGDRTHLTAAVTGAVTEAVAGIDVRSHEGVHPRVGAADVVPIVPLGDTTLDDCRELALDIGHRLWAELKVPVYFYGHGTQTNLADIRAGRAKIDLGGPAPHPTAGAVCVGARLPLIAFNVILPGLTPEAARALARSLRESAGGMRGVQALVFELPGGRLQLSMNLFRVGETKPSDVISELERRGVALGDQELVGLCPAHAAPPVAAGRLLEGRLASAAALAAAARCLRRGGTELTALAGRLESEAGGLHSLGLDQDALLAGAERSAALSRVLGAARMLDAELDGLLASAARGLRSALSATAETAHPQRVAALDRWLGAG